MNSCFVLPPKLAIHSFSEVAGCLFLQTFYLKLTYIQLIQSSWWRTMLLLRLSWYLRLLSWLFLIYISILLSTILHFWILIWYLLLWLHRFSKAFLTWWLIGLIVSIFWLLLLLLVQRRLSIWLFKYIICCLVFIVIWIGFLWILSRRFLVLLIHAVVFAS